jgi:NTE family protein
VIVREVVIHNDSGLGESVLRAQLSVAPGDVLDLEGLREDIDHVYGRGDFESVTFELLPAPDGQRDLVIHATDKSWGPTHIRFGLALSSNLQGSSAFTVASQVNMRELNSLGAEWRTNVAAGDRTGVATEFYQPLVPSGVLFVAPRASATLAEAPAGTGGVIDVTLYSAGIDLGANIGTWSELRVGVTRIQGEVDLDLIVPVSGFDFDDGALEAGCVVDTLDDAEFPRWGTRFGGTWIGGYESLGADTEYQKVGTAGTAYASLGRTTFGIGASYETAVDGSLPIYRLPGLGGFTRLSGLEGSAVAGQHAGLVAALVRHRLAGRHADTLGFPVYIGATIEAGNAWQSRDDVWHDLILSGSAFLAVNTPLGPTYVAYGLAEGGEDSFYLFVGQPF